MVASIGSIERSHRVPFSGSMRGHSKPGGSESFQGAARVFDPPVYLLGTLGALRGRESRSPRKKEIIALAASFSFALAPKVV